MPWYEVVAWLVFGPPLFGLGLVLALGIVKGLCAVWRGLRR